MLVLYLHERHDFYFFKLSFNSLGVHLTKPAILFTRELELIGCLGFQSGNRLSAFLVFILFSINFMVCFCFVYSNKSLPTVDNNDRVFGVMVWRFDELCNGLMIYRDLVSLGWETTKKLLSFNLFAYSFIWVQICVPPRRSTTLWYLNQ